MRGQNNNSKVQRYCTCWLIRNRLLNVSSGLRVICIVVFHAIYLKAIIYACNLNYCAKIVKVTVSIAGCKLQSVSNSV